MNPDDKLLRELNQNYLGAGGHGITNPIQGFNPKRRNDQDFSLGKMVGKFGTTIKQIFGTNVEFEEYSMALLGLI